MELGIADFSDDAGYCYPSVATLAAKCRVSARQAIRLINQLVDSGELEVRKGCGPAVRTGRLNLFRIRLENLKGREGMTDMSPLADVSPVQGVTSMTARGDIHDMQGVSPVSPKPSENHQKEPPVVRAKRSRRSADGQTFKTWYEQTKASNPKVLSDDDPIFAWAQTLGLSRDFLNVAWCSFKAKHMTSDKLQKSWPQTFLNYLKQGWTSVWFLDREGVWRLNTAGKQLAIEHGYDPEMTCGKTADPWAGAI